MAVNLGLIRAGTYSANTRALSLLYFTPETELRAFQEYLPDANPLLLSRQQALLLLYALIENDGEVLAPLWNQLAAKYPDGFNDRDAGNLLPEIYRAVIARHRTRLLPADVRDRLLVLEKSADSIAQARQSDKYTGAAHGKSPRACASSRSPISACSASPTLSSMSTASAMQGEPGLTR